MYTDISKQLKHCLVLRSTHVNVEEGATTEHVFFSKERKGCSLTAAL